MKASSRPCRRTTTTPKARLVTIAQLLELICSFRCMEHKRRPGVGHVENGRVEYTGCCEDLLDLVEHALEQPAAMAMAWHVSEMVM